MHVPPPVLALGAAVAQRALTRDSAPPRGVRVTLAATTALASMTLAGSAASLFRRRGTTVDPAHPGRASSLVTTGPFVLTRNPMYVGMAGVLVAHALARGSWRAAVPLVGFVLVLDRLQIPQEEAALTERFGEPYTAYCQRVPRWVGVAGTATRR